MYSKKSIFLATIIVLLSNSHAFSKGFNLKKLGKIKEITKTVENTVNDVSSVFDSNDNSSINTNSNTRNNNNYRMAVQISNPTTKEEQVINRIIGRSFYSFLEEYNYPDFEFEPIKRYFRGITLDVYQRKFYDLCEIYCEVKNTYPLLYAVLQQDENQVKELLDTKININQASPLCGTALDLALEILKYGGQKWNLPGYSAKCEPLLFKIIPMLKSAGIKSKEIVLTATYINDILFDRFDSDTKKFFNYEPIILLWSCDNFNFDLNAIKKECNKTFLNDKQQKLLKLIENYCDLKKNYPLILATIVGNVYRVMEFAEAKKDLNKAHPKYGTALDICYNNQGLEESRDIIATILRKAGAKSPLEEKAKVEKAEEAKRESAAQSKLVQAKKELEEKERLRKLEAEKQAKLIKAKQEAEAKKAKLLKTKQEVGIKNDKEAIEKKETDFQSRLSKLKQEMKEREQNTAIKTEKQIEQQAEQTSKKEDKSLVDNISDFFTGGN